MLRSISKIHNVKKSLGSRLRGSSYQDVDVNLIKVSLSNEDYQREWTYDVPGGEADARNSHSYEVAVFAKEEIAAFQEAVRATALEQHPAGELSAD